ncbi:MAG: type II toxin-antitoxin system VapC family toxin [Gammaproteobacteria bacterium]|nr:type II toxin-antitoxin system VapC family toxin [Gammaproteobacteria bacterium]
MIVADAKVIAYWLIEGENTANARRLFDIDPVWIVPALCRHELANVIASYVKHQAMLVSEVSSLWQNLELLINGSEYELDLDAVIALAVEKNLSAYDAQYLFLAMSRDIPLITQDKKLIAAVDTAFSISAYLNHQGMV